MRLPKNVFQINNSLLRFQCEDVTIDKLVFPFPRNFNNTEKNCFVISTKELKGKFDISKADDLKIPKGPLYGKLKNGFPVVLDDGRTILPEQVIGRGELSRYIMISNNLIQNSIYNYYAN